MGLDKPGGEGGNEACLCDSSYNPPAETVGFIDIPKSLD